MITRQTFKGNHPLLPLGEVAEFLDNLRKPITAANRISGPYPYYGANGQQDSVADYIFDEPLVLLAEDGGMFDNPDRGIAYAIDGKSWVNNHAHVLRPKGCIDLRYLLRVLENYDISPWITGTTRAKLTKSAATKIEIPLPHKNGKPDLEEQKRIAAILDKADGIRRKRQQALRLTDDFLRSVFLDMFGDPVTNPMGWDQSPLGNVCDVRDGTHDSPKYVESGFPLLTSKNFKGGGIDATDANLISEADFHQINRRSKVDKGDLVMPMIGTIGNPVLIQEEPNFAIKNVALIKFTDASPNNVFVRELLCSHYFNFATQRSNRGGTQKFVALNDIRQIPVPLPPAPFQLQFSGIAEDTAKISTRMNRQPTSEDLFASLQQRAFRGEL